MGCGIDTVISNPVERDLASKDYHAASFSKLHLLKNILGDQGPWTFVIRAVMAHALLEQGFVTYGLMPGLLWLPAEQLSAFSV